MHDDSEGTNVMYDRYFVPVLSVACLLPAGAAVLMGLHPLGRVRSIILICASLVHLLSMLIVPLANLAGAAVLISVGVLAPFAICIVILALLPMGVDSLMMTLFDEVTVEAIRTRQWSVNQVIPDFGLHQAQGSLLSQDIVVGRSLRRNNPYC